MSRISRRQFLGAACAAVALRRPAAGAPGMTIGLNLSSVAESLRQDFPGTLRRVAALGFREVELPLETRSRRAADIRKALDDAGLRCVSAHWDMWDDGAETQSAIDAASELGLEYLVTGFPALMTPEGLKPSDGTPADIRMLAEKMTWNDWRWNFDWFNHVGGYAQKANIQFVYHNHGMEFRKFNGVTVLDDLLSRTDPTRVKLELDCVEAERAGQDPVALIGRYGERVAMLHVGAEQPLQWRGALEAGRRAAVAWVFIDEPGPFSLLRASLRALGFE